MKAVLVKIFKLLFGIALDTTKESVDIVKTTVKLWCYLSVAIGAFLVAILGYSLISLFV